MLKYKLGLDAKDVKILSLFMKDPDISQTEIAQVLDLSQPSVNARIHKLKKRGILATQIGLDFSKSAMHVARVDFTAAHAHDILQKLMHCSFFVNGFILSGRHNVSIFIIGHDLKKIESIIDKHMRRNPDIKDINMSVVVSTVKPFICSIDLEKQHKESCTDPMSCQGCQLYDVDV